MKRIIVKVGTKVLSKEGGVLDVEFLRDLVGQIVLLRTKGVEVVLVTSGAVGAGKSVVSLGEHLSKTIQKQVFAAVGQVKLMTTYAELFAHRGYHCAQVLATKEDFRDEEHYQNMQNCFEGLLLDDVIPIVNENDVVATTELLFTDNDELAGLVARQLKADTLVIMTGTDGILDDAKQSVAMVDSTNAEAVQRFITPDTSTGGRGGMASKFQTAREASSAGTTVHIVQGRKPHVLVGLFEGVVSGTRFASH